MRQHYGTSKSNIYIYNKNLPGYMRILINIQVIITTDSVKETRYLREIIHLFDSYLFYILLQYNFSDDIFNSYDLYRAGQDESVMTYTGLDRTNQL